MNHQRIQQGEKPKRKELQGLRIKERELQEEIRLKQRQLEAVQTRIQKLWR